MSEMKHTPGPWSVGREYGHYVHPKIAIMREVSYVDGVPPTVYHLADVHHPSSDPGTVGAEQRAANARLIAAAPELLEACESALLFLDYMAEQSVAAGLARDEQRKLRAAIAKAKGSTNEN